MWCVSREYELLLSDTLGGVDMGRYSEPIHDCLYFFCL